MCIIVVRAFFFTHSHGIAVKCHSKTPNNGISLLRKTLHQKHSINMCEKGENLNRWKWFLLELICIEESRLEHYPMNSSHLLFFLHREIPVCVCLPRTIIYTTLYACIVYSAIQHLFIYFCFKCGWNHGISKSIRFEFK